LTLYFKKYRFISLRSIVILLFTFSTFAVHAQRLSEELDSLSIDTTITDDDYSEVIPAEEEQRPFLKKTDFENEYDSLSFRNIPAIEKEKLKNDRDFWYANYVFKKAEPRQKNYSMQKLVEVLLWLIIIGGFAAFVIWYLSYSNVGLFRKAPKQIYVEGEEPETDDIFRINYPGEIEKAITNKNYRFAVRLMYLQLLKNLSEKNIINYKQERTNFDYLLQLSSTSYYHDFFRVTRNYEYSWYGHFDVNAGIFDIIRSDFENFERKVMIN